MVAPNNRSNPSSSDTQHLKFNRDVLPDFKRRPESWEQSGAQTGAEKMSDAETDSILKWVGLGIIILVIGGIAAFTLVKRSAQKDAADSYEPSALEVVKQERKKAKEVIENYMGTRDIEARMKYVRRADVVRPLMEAYYQSSDLYPLKVWNFEQIEPRSIGALPFWYAVVNTPEGREVLLLEKVGGDFKIDWETHVGLNPIMPESYITERPAGKHAFRVYVSPVEYYSGVFSDPEEVLSAKLEFANSGVEIYGYIDRKSPDYATFLKMVEGGRKVPLILMLVWPDDSGRGGDLLPQVNISKLVSERWVVIE